MNDSTDRLARQMSFVLEIDRLKGVLRQTLTEGGLRQENSAEHSWHIAVMTILLAEYADEPVDVARVLKMLLIHDVVEVDAGDTFCYDEEANSTKEGRERAAADRLFGLLPPDQGRELRQLWEEFEAAATPDARFANSMDRLQPMMLNFATQGRSWRKHGVHSDRVLARNAPIANGSKRLWEYARGLVGEALTSGYLEK